MTRFYGLVNVGIREKDTDKLLAAYPETLDSGKEDVERKVMDWFYKKNCSTSEMIERVYVDNLTERELKSLQ